MPLQKRLAAEFIGTFWLVLGGCGSAVLAATFPNTGIGFAGVALAFGLTLLTMAFAIGGISGMPYQSGGYRRPLGGSPLRRQGRHSVHRRAGDRRHRRRRRPLPYSQRPSEFSRRRTVLPQMVTAITRPGTILCSPARSARSS